MIQFHLLPQDIPYDMRRQQQSPCGCFVSLCSSLDLFLHLPPSCSYVRFYLFRSREEDILSYMDRPEITNALYMGMYLILWWGTSPNINLLQERRVSATSQSSSQSGLCQGTSPHAREKHFQDRDTRKEKLFSLL